MRNRLSLIPMALCIGTIAAATTAQTPPPGDPVQGKRQSGQCTSCHSLEKDGPNGVGPNLYGVLGKPAATGKPGYPFSPALRAAKIVWTDEQLDLWLKSPAALVPGTKMAFVGIPKAASRRDLIAYLKQETGAK